MESEKMIKKYFGNFGKMESEKIFWKLKNLKNILEI